MDNKEPKRDDAAEQEARKEEYKKKAEQLLELQRPELLSPKLFQGVLNTICFFITALVAFGVLAYYINHVTTAKVAFVASGLLLLALPVSTIWYLRALFRKPVKKAEGKQSLSDRIVQSSVGRALVRLTNNRIFNLVQYSFLISMVAWAIIRLFPLHPRLALAVIVVYTALFLYNAILEVDKVHTKSYRRTVESFVKISEILDTQLLVSESLKEYSRTVAEYSKALIDAAAAPSHMEAHETITAALKAIHHTTEVIAGRSKEPEPNQLDAAPAEKTDKEPNDH